MREPKQSDSPSGYCREVYPSRRPRTPRLVVSGPVTLDGDTVYVNGMLLSTLLRSFTAPDTGGENNLRYSQLVISVEDPRG